MNQSSSDEHLECLNAGISTTLFRLTGEQQEKIKLLIREIQSKDTENISLQRTLQVAEQLAHDTNDTLTFTQTTLTSRTKELKGTAATLNSERASTQKIILSLQRQLNSSTATFAHGGESNAAQCNESVDLVSAKEDSIAYESRQKTMVGNSGAKINADPPTNHGRSEELNNDAIAFAGAVASLQHAAKEKDEIWKETIEAMSTGNTNIAMKFDFDSNGPWSGLTVARAIEMVKHLPDTIEALEIYNSKFGGEFIETVIEKVKSFRTLKRLDLDNILVGGKDEGQKQGARLAEELGRHTTITTLAIYNTDLIGTENVDKWEDALMENKTLTELWLDGVKAKEIGEQLKEKTKDRSPKLTIYND